MSVWKILCIWTVCIQYVCFQLFDGQPWLYNKASCSLMWLLGAGFPVASRLTLWVLTAGGEKWATRSILISIADNYKSQRKQPLKAGRRHWVVLSYYSVSTLEKEGNVAGLPEGYTSLIRICEETLFRLRGSGYNLHWFSYAWGNALVRSDVGVSFGSFQSPHCWFFTWTFDKLPKKLINKGGKNEAECWHEIKIDTFLNIFLSYFNSSFISACFFKEKPQTTITFNNNDDDNNNTDLGLYFCNIYSFQKAITRLPKS